VKPSKPLYYQQEQNMKKKLSVGHGALFQQMANNIAKHGRQVISVMGSSKELGFSYTVGNQEKNLPELLLISNFDPNEIAPVLNSLSEVMIKSGKPIPQGECAAISAVPIMIYPGGTAAKAKYTVQAGQFYNDEEYDVLQLVFPDPKGLWPGDPKCHKDFQVPILCLTGMKNILR